MIIHGQDGVYDGKPSTADRMEDGVYDGTKRGRRYSRNAIKRWQRMKPSVGALVAKTLTGGVIPETLTVVLVDAKPSVGDA